MNLKTELLAFTKLIAVSLVSVLVLAACGERDPPSMIPDPQPNRLKLTKDLDGCTGYDVYYSKDYYVTAIRCPNSAVSVEKKVGKQTETTIVVDGVTYVPASATAATVPAPAVH